MYDSVFGKEVLPVYVNTVEDFELALIVERLNFLIDESEKVEM